MTYFGTLVHVPDTLQLWWPLRVLNLWRRHLKGCPHRVRTYKKCGCQGTLHGKWIKKSLDLRNWEAAQKLVRDWEADGAGSEEISVRTACESFAKDCEARNLSTASLDKYKLLTDELKEKFGRRPVRSLGLPELRQYRESWDIAPISART